MRAKLIGLEQDFLLLYERNVNAEQINYKADGLNQLLLKKEREKLEYKNELHKVKFVNLEQTIKSKQ